MESQTKNSTDSNLKDNEDLKPQTVAIGVDLGTTNSSISVSDGVNVYTIVPDDVYIGSSIPSIVTKVSETQNIFVYGLEAKNRGLKTPDLRVMEAKRMLIKDPNFKYRLGNQEYTPVEIMAKLLEYVVSVAKKSLKQDIKKIVISVPARYQDGHREATKAIGTIANLEVLKIINQPTAAALSYGLLNSDENKRLFVYDLGGGTSDISLIEISKGIVRVEAVDGELEVGGKDMDAILQDWILLQIKNLYPNLGPLAANKKSQLFSKLEQAKIKCSTSPSASIFMDYIGIDTKTNEPIELDITLERSTLTQLLRPLFIKSLNPILKISKDLEIDWTTIYGILMVGGPSSMPSLEEVMYQTLPLSKYNIKILRDVNPLDCVAKGAALQCALNMGLKKDIVTLDVTPLSLGVETQDNIMTTLISRNTTIPVRKSEVFTTAVDNQPEVFITILQGERTRANENKELKTFKLENIRKAPKGTPRIEVTFDIDSNGILNVIAQDQDTKAKQEVVVQNASGGISKDEINRLIKEAEENRDADEKYKQKIETIQKAKSIVQRVKTILEDKSLDLENQENITEIKTLTESLNKELEKSTAEIDQLEIDNKINILEPKIQQLMIDLHSKKAKTQEDSTQNNKQGPEEQDNSSQSNSQDPQKDLDQTN